MTTATTKANEAAASATSAGTYATNASNSATAAAGSATTAATSATAAQTAQTAAQAAQTAAEAVYDSFDDRYLGAKASFPTVDNDGNALLMGALFYHTAVTPKQLYIWNGSAWDAAAFNGSGAVASFNGRSGAVTLSSSDVTGALGFTPVSNAGSYADPSWITSLTWSKISSKPTTLSGYGITDAQATLVSGTNIKTVNGVSILGSGDLAIASGVTSFNTRTGAITLSSADVTGALGFTPYNATNPSGYITSSALTPYLTTASASSTYLPLTGGTLSGNLTFSSANARITGDMSNATVASRLLFQTSTANANTLVTALPSGTAVNAQYQVYNSSDPTNSSIGAFVVSASQVRLVSGYIGTGTMLPITFIFSNTEAARFDPTTRNFLIGTSTDDATNKLQVNGTIKSLAGGFVFPDGTTQTTAASGSGGSLQILDEGTSLTASAASINFAGSGVTATTVGGAVTVTIPGASGGGGATLDDVIALSIALG